MKTLMKLLIILIVFITSCKQSVNKSNKQNDINQKSTKTNKSNVNNINKKNSCIVYQDSTVIKEFVVKIKDDLVKLSKKEFIMKYDLSKELHEKDKITLLNSEPEISFEEENNCLICILYFNYNFLESQSLDRWKGEHQTIMKMEKRNGVFKIESIEHF